MLATIRPVKDANYNLNSDSLHQLFLRSPNVKKRVSFNFAHYSYYLSLSIYVELRNVSYENEKLIKKIEHFRTFVLY